MRSCSVGQRKLRAAGVARFASSGAPPLAARNCRRVLSADQLRLQWRNHLGGIAPAHIAGWLLMRVLAYRIQATAFGDLDRAILRRLREIRDEAFELGRRARMIDDMQLSSTLAWLVDAGAGSPDAGQFLAELGVRLIDDALPLAGPPTPAEIAITTIR